MQACILILMAKATAGSAGLLYLLHINLKCAHCIHFIGNKKAILSEIVP